MPAWQADKRLTNKPGCVTIFKNVLRYYDGKSGSCNYCTNSSFYKSARADQTTGEYGTGGIKCIYLTDI
jgi:hypothetical protein